MIQEKTGPTPITPAVNSATLLDNLDLAKIAIEGRRYRISPMGDDIKKGAFKASFVLQPDTSVHSIDNAYDKMREHCLDGWSFTSWLDHVKKRKDDASDDVWDMCAERAGSCLLRRNPALTELIDMYLRYGFGEPTCNQAFKAWLDRIREYHETHGDGEEEHELFSD